MNNDVWYNVSIELDGVTLDVQYSYYAGCGSVFERGSGVALTPPEPAEAEINVIKIGKVEVTDLLIGRIPEIEEKVLEHEANKL